MTTDAVRLAHISDLHLGPLPAFSPRHWNLKRGLGFINWQRKRRRIHQRDVIDRLVADMSLRAPDHIAVTGDLVNIGLPEEYTGAARWLAGLGAPDRVTVVPGNHDIYVRLAADAGIAHWAPYMQPCAWGAKLQGEAAFPFVRCVGDVALIGLNSAHPTLPAVATGRLGVAQRAALAKLLDATAAAGLVSVVLIHHPPLPGQIDRRHALADAAELETVLSEHGADLVLHGHTHLDTLLRRPSRRGETVVCGIASGSAGHMHKGAPLARYNLFRLWREGGKARIEMQGRGISAETGEMIDLGKHTLA